MATEVKSPTFPESVADGTIANWVKKEGEKVQQDEVIAEIETDKVVLEVVAPFDGVISKIHKPAGEIVQSAELIAEFEKVSNHSADNEAEQHPEPTLKTEVAPEPIAPKEEEKLNGPAATRLLKENNLASDDVVASGKGGRVTKADVVNHLSESSSKAPQKKEVIGIQPSQTGRDEERVPMSRLRATIAKRLLSVKQETAMLTTFNEVDMPVSYTHLTLPTKRIV